MRDCCSAALDRDEPGGDACPLFKAHQSWGIRNARPAPVIDYLKELLRGELAARDQYFLHSRMYADWGLSRLYERINHEMEEETQHADALLKRILFLEGTPDMTPEPINPGKTVPDMLRNDLALEYRVRAALAQGIALPSSMATTRPATCWPCSCTTPRKTTPTGWSSSSA